MEIMKLPVSVPVKEIVCEVVHFSPRKATVFEMAIMETIKKFGRHKIYSKFTVAEIFEKFMGVSMAACVVASAMENLIRLKVVRNNGKAHSVSAIRVGDLELEETGNIMLEKGMLPGVSKKDEMKVFYYPLKNTVSAPGSSEPRLSSPVGIAPDPGQFVSFPQDLIIGLLRAGRYDFINAGSEIEGVSKKREKTYWANVRASLILSGEGKLRMDLNDEDYNDFFNRDPDTLPAYLVSEFRNDSGFDLQSVSAAEVCQKAVAVSRISDSMKKIYENGYGASFFTYHKGFEEVIGFGKTRSAVVVYSHPEVPEDGVKVEWNDDLNSVKIFIGAAMPAAGCDYVNSRGECCRFAELQMEYGRSVFALPVSVTFDISGNGGLDGIKSDVERRLAASPNIKDRTSIIFWTEPREAWNKLFGEIVNLDENLFDRANEAERIGTMIVEFSGGKIDLPWREDIASMTLDAIRNEVSLDLPAFEKVIAVSKKEYMKKYAATVVGEALARIPACRNISDSIAFWSVIGNGQAANSKEAEAKLFNADVIKDYMRAYGENRGVAFKNAGNRLETSLNDLMEAEKYLAAVSGGIDFTASCPGPEELKKKVRRIDSEKFEAARARWKDALEKLAGGFDGYAEALEGSCVQIRDANIRAVSGIIQKYSTYVPPRFSNVFVVDTNAFIEYPEILRKFSEKDYIIVSAKVIDELDGFKNDDFLKNKAKAAIRNISNHVKLYSNLKFEHSEAELLGPDYKKLSADNLILSVALKYRSASPVVMTSDRGLELKCATEEIKCIKPFEIFEKSELLNIETAKKGSNGKNKMKKRQVA